MGGSRGGIGKKLNTDSVLIDIAAFAAAEFGWTHEAIMDMPLGVLQLYIRSHQRANKQDTGMTLSEMEHAERMRDAGIERIADASPEKLQEIFNQG